MQTTWLRQTAEPSKAFRGFETYRDLLENRSLSKVAQIHAQKSGKVGGNTASADRIIARWSSRYNWVSRTKDYDAHLSAMVRKGREAAIVSRQMDLALEQMDLANTRLQHELDEQLAFQETAKSLRLKIVDLLRLPSTTISVRNFDSEGNTLLQQHVAGLHPSEIAKLALAYASMTAQAITGHVKISRSQRIVEPAAANSANSNNDEPPREILLALAPWPDEEDENSTEENDK